MRPISPDIGVDEQMVAEEQSEFKPLAVAFIKYDDGTPAIISRWTLTEGERAQIFAGQDIFLELQVQQMVPVVMRVGKPDWAR